MKSIKAGSIRDGGCHKTFSLQNIPLYHIFFSHVCAAVSYIPEKVVARPGENVTVYCVFNDHSINASTAMWMLNFQQPLHPSQYHPVNQWVSGTISKKLNDFPVYF